MMPAAIIGIPLALLLISQLRSLGRLEQASRQMLTETGIRVAEELATRILTDLSASSVALLDSIPEETVRSHDLAAIADVLVRDKLFPTGLGSLFAGVERESGSGDGRRGFSVFFYEESAAPTLATPASGFGAGAPTLVSGPEWVEAGRGRLASYVVERVGEIEPGGAADACGSVMIDGQGYLLAIRAYYADVTHSRVSHFVGIALHAERLTKTHFARQVTEIRDGERAFSMNAPLEISILDAGRREIYRTGPSLRAKHAHEAQLPLDLLGHDPRRAAPGAHGATVSWSVQSGYPGTDAAALARSSTNQQRQLLFLVTLVAGVGIVMSGRAIGRELGVAELKAEFVSSISHDLKTPIASIQVLADILQGGSLQSPDRVTHYGKVIGEETRKLGKLIDGMLEFEKIDGGGRMYKGQEIDLRAPVRDAVGDLATQLRETGFRTELRLPARPVPFIGDADALLHAFGNLIGNAVKYSEDERFLRVEMQVRDANAVIEVHDRGRGIPAGERTKIFDRFYRVRRDAGTDPAGTGLGLSIAQHIVRSHGGRISVSGKPKGGSVFTIEIPLTYDASVPPSGAG